MNAPIIIFTYNRVESVVSLMSSLKQNELFENSDLFIFSDGPKNNNDEVKVNKVREYCRCFRNDNKKMKIQIFESRINKGLADSIINGVDEVIKKYGRVIVLEDDLIVSPHFLKYMNEALDYYKNNNRIWSISGFSRDIEYFKDLNIDVYFSLRAQSWSWATWIDRWEKVDWDVSSYEDFKLNIDKRRKFNLGGNDLSSMLDRQQCAIINSWAIRFCYSQFLNNAYTVQPLTTLVQNYGQDGSGTNCNYVREMSEISTKIEWNYRDFNEDKCINENLKKTRKKIPIWKLFGSFIVFAVFKGKILPSRYCK